MTTKKKESQTKQGEKSYQQFLRALEFVGMGLKTSSSRIDRATYFRLRESKKRLRKKIVTKYEVNDMARDYFNLMATFRLTLEERKTGISPLAIEATYHIHFHGKPPIREEFAKRFANSEFELIVWPFFRQFVYDISARMSIPPISVPLSTMF